MSGKRTKTDKPNAPTLLWRQIHELCAQRGDICAHKEPKFYDGRQWRFDFALTWFTEDTQRFGIEIEGGSWINGRHNRASGFIKDMEKYNHAALMGYRVLRFTPQQVLDGSAIEFIRLVLAVR